MEKFPHLPDEGDYGVNFNPNEWLEQQTDGGEARTRRDIIAPAHTVTLSFTCNPKKYAEIVAFVGDYVGRNCEPFLIDLQIYSNAYTEETVVLVPDSFNLVSHNALNYVVSMEVEIDPNGEPLEYSGDAVVLHVRLDDVDGFTDLTGRHTVTPQGAIAAGTTAGLFGRQATAFAANNYLRVTGNLGDFGQGTAFTWEVFGKLTGFYTGTLGYTSAEFLGNDSWEWKTEPLDSTLNVDAGSGIISLGNVEDWGGADPETDTPIGAGFHFYSVSWDGVYKYAHIDGKQVAKVASTNPLLAGNGALCMGRSGDNTTSSGFPFWFVGAMQEMRMSQGLCRYTEDYTVPAEPFVADY